MAVPANGGRPRSAFGGSGAEARTEQRHHVVGLWVATDHRLREDQVVADMDVKDAARSRHQFDGADGRLKLFEDSRCQTDSVWQRASRDAVLDANDGSTGHEPMLSPGRRVRAPKPRQPALPQQQGHRCGRPQIGVPVTAPQNSLGYRLALCRNGGRSSARTSWSGTVSSSRPAV